jgi:DNA polymerase III alpha subunit
MRATLKEIRARGVDDIMVALALYRPGPLTGGLKDAFVRRHRGLEPPGFLHPSLVPLLGDTYGVILYQEQVLRVAHELAGLSLADADLLRRAMSHFDPGKQMITLRNKFIAGAFTHNKVPMEIAAQIWELMAAFAGYGFPKAHAASYAQLAWRLAWCKAHHPALFIAAVLANWGGYYSQRVYMMEARRMGLRIYPPHINHASKEFSVGLIQRKQALFMGLAQVRELTQHTISQIIRQRPFHSLTDFLARVDPRPREVDNLVQVGAFEGLGNIPGLLEQLKEGSWRSGQIPLFSQQNTSQEDWSLEEKATAQKTILGVSVIAHPLELYSSQIETFQAITTVEASARINQSVRVAGMRQTWRRSRTNRGDTIYYMALEDLEGMLDVVISSSVYRRHRAVLKGNGPFVIEGVVELNRSRAEPFIRVKHVWNIASS